MSLSEKHLKSISDLDEYLKNLTPAELFDHEYRTEATLGAPECIYLLGDNELEEMLSDGYWDNKITDDVLKIYVFKKYPRVFWTIMKDELENVIRLQRVSEPEERPIRVKLIEKK